MVQNIFQGFGWFTPNEEEDCCKKTELTLDSEDGRNLTSKLKVEANPVNLEVRICRRAEEPLTQIEVR